MYSHTVGREGRCKQITLACVHSVSATSGLPSLMVCVLSLSKRLRPRLLCRELSEAGPRFHALPRCKPLRFRYSGSPQGCRHSWACALCLSQARAARVTRCSVSWSLPLISSHAPATRCSVCTAGAPSQAGGDRPESQECLVSDRACMQVGN